MAGRRCPVASCSRGMNEISSAGSRFPHPGSFRSLLVGRPADMACAHSIGVFGEAPGRPRPPCVASTRPSDEQARTVASDDSPLAWSSVPPASNRRGGYSPPRVARKAQRLNPTTWIEAAAVVGAAGPLASAGSVAIRRLGRRGRTSAASRRGVAFGVAQTRSQRFPTRKGLQTRCPQPAQVSDRARPGVHR